MISLKIDSHLIQLYQLSRGCWKSQLLFLVNSLMEIIVQKTSNSEYERSEVQSTKDKVFDEVNRETGGQVKCKAPNTKSLTKWTASGWVGVVQSTKGGKRLTKWTVKRVGGKVRLLP